MEVDGLWFIDVGGSRCQGAEREAEDPGVGNTAPLRSERDIEEDGQTLDTIIRK